MISKIIFLVLLMLMCSAQGLELLDLPEGSKCSKNGVNGVCANIFYCLNAPGDIKNDDLPSVCTYQGEVPIICCTDCELVNDTRTAVISPTSGVVLWKNGQKARDNCLQYIKELPYQCKGDGFYAGIMKKLNEDKKCYEYIEWTGEGEPESEHFSPYFPVTNYPFQVLLGYYYGYNPLRTQIKWSTKGVIVSERYILTAAHARTDGMEPGPILLGGYFVGGTAWADLKRFISHPEYRPPAFYHDIALVEVVKPIEFNDLALPVCLHVDDEVSIKETFTITWTADHNTLRVDFEELSEEECKAGVGKPKFLKNGYNHTTQICYGIKMNETDLPSNSSKVSSPETCKSLRGTPLMVDTQFSSCVHTAIGLTTFGTRTCGTEPRKPSVYLTRISYYVPWIESIVWP